jgi:hypothetical protein
VLVYAWADPLLFSGQTLASQPSPDERRIMLELGDPTAWRTRNGVHYDEIRMVSPDGITSSQLLPRSETPPRWSAMKIPGSCVRNVTIAIFGSAAYNETPFRVVDGVVRLDGPQAYRRRVRLDVELGISYQTQQKTRDAQPGGGVGFLVTAEPRIPMSFGAFGSVHFTKKSFVALDSSPATSPDEQVGIWRLGAGLLAEYWHSRLAHFYVRGGIELDSPLSFGNNGKLGILSKSFPVEVGAVLLLGRAGRLRLSIGAGLDFDVDHNRFETDFLGSPTSAVESRTEPFLAARLGVRLR